MHAEDTFDPSHAATRRIESMSDIVAEMVLGACGEDESSPGADAAALEAARSIAIAPPPPARSSASVLAAPRPRTPSRGRAWVAILAAGALVLFGSAIALFLTLR